MQWFLVALCRPVTDNIHTPPTERNGNSWGGGGSQGPKNFKEMYEVKFGNSRRVGDLIKKSLPCNYTSQYNKKVYNVVQLHPWYNVVFRLVQCTVIYDYE